LSKTFADEVLCRVGLPRARRYEVFTQEPLDRSGKVDLILRGFDATGLSATVLHGEHKEPRF
jgi:hypothetical protein